LPTTGSPGSEQALAVARSLGRQRSAQLSAFDAVSEPIRVHDPWNVEVEIEEGVAKALAPLAELGDVEPTRRRVTQPTSSRETQPRSTSSSWARASTSQQLGDALRARRSCCRLPALERLRGARALTLAAPAAVSVEFVSHPPINSTLDWISLPPWSRRADGPGSASRGRLRQRWLVLATGSRAAGGSRRRARCR
jgi:hypothetical protein